MAFFVVMHLAFVAIIMVYSTNINSNKKAKLLQESQQKKNTWIRTEELCITQVRTLPHRIPNINCCTLQWMEERWQREEISVVRQKVLRNRQHFVHKIINILNKCQMARFLRILNFIVYHRTERMHIKKRAKQKKTTSGLNAYDAIRTQTFKQKAIESKWGLKKCVCVCG